MHKRIENSSNRERRVVGIDAARDAKPHKRAHTRLNPCSYKIPMRVWRSKKKSNNHIHRNRNPQSAAMAKDKKTKPAAAAVPETDPRLFALVGAFLKDAGLSSSAKIFEAETSTRKVNSKKSSAVPTPKSLDEALLAWEKSLLVKGEADEDSGNESEDEDSDSGEDSSDNSDDDSSDGEDSDMKDDSSATVSGDEKAKVKKEKKDDR